LTLREVDHTLINWVTPFNEAALLMNRVHTSRDGNARWSLNWRYNGRACEKNRRKVWDWGEVDKNRFL